MIGMFHIICPNLEPALGKFYGFAYFGWAFDGAAPDRADRAVDPDSRVVGLPDAALRLGPVAGMVEAGVLLVERWILKNPGRLRGPWCFHDQKTERFSTLAEQPMRGSGRALD